MPRIATGTLIAESLRSGTTLHGDAGGRAEAEAHARSHGVPEPQIDWP